MRPAPLARSAQIDIDLLKECCVGKIRALLAPFVKLLRAVVGLKKPAQVRQAFGIVKRERAQQQRIDHAEDACVRADTDGQRENREAGVPGTAGPKAKRVPCILRHFARKL